MASLTLEKPRLEDAATLLLQEARWSLECISAKK